ncbi:MAG: BlaI/MecI/CopY family transcriptional regulator [Planctomycetota bacterium]
MARPKSTELTDRELVVMQAFWRNGESLTAEDARNKLADSGEELAYATVANVVRALCERGFLKQLSDKRPFQFVAVKSFESVSNRLLGDFLTRLFGGSREAMLVQLLERKKLTSREREYLQQVLAEEEGES